MKNWMPGINDPRGDWASSDLLRMEHRDNSVYTIVSPSGKKWTPKSGNSWRHPEQEMLELIKTNQIWFGNDGNSMPRRKRFLSEVKQTVVPQTIWKFEDVGHTQEAKQELNSIIREFGASFDTPKPTKLIKKIIRLISESNPTPIILDFFAGSGTTGHAVLEMNKEDGGRRQFILVTNNEVTDKTRRQLESEGLAPEAIEEQGICRAVTYPRLQKVIEGYTNPKGEKVAGTGGKLRYFRTGFVPAGSSGDQLAYNLRRRCTEMLCFRENVFTPLAATEQYEIFQDHDRVLAILHDEHPRHRDALRAALHALPGLRECKLYVFSLDREVNADDYADFQNVTLENVPAKIIDLYKREVQRLSAVQSEAGQTTKIE